MANLARPGDGARPLFREEIGNLDLVIVGDGLLDVVHADIAHRANKVLQRFLGQIQRNDATVEGRIG